MCAHIHVENLMQVYMTAFRHILHVSGHDCNYVLLTTVRVYFMDM